MLVVLAQTIAEKRLNIPRAMVAGNEISLQGNVSPSEIISLLKDGLGRRPEGTWETQGCSLIHQFKIRWPQLMRHQNLEINKTASASARDSVQEKAISWFKLTDNAEYSVSVAYQIYVNNACHTKLSSPDHEGESCSRPETNNIIIIIMHLLCAIHPG